MWGSSIFLKSLRDHRVAIGASDLDGAPRARDATPVCRSKSSAKKDRGRDRAVDAAANPYLAAAFLLAAGLEGVAEGLDPGEPVDDLIGWLEPVTQAEIHCAISFCTASAHQAAVCRDTFSKNSALRVKGAFPLVIDMFKPKHAPRRPSGTTPWPGRTK